MKTLVLALALCAAGASAQDTPLSQAISMLQTMDAKSKKEQKEEEVAMAKFSQWCEDTTAEKQNAIKEETQEIEQLDAAIEKGVADSKEASNKIAEVSALIAMEEKDLEVLAQIVAKETEDYQASHLDYSESLDALDRAITFLKAKATTDIAQTKPEFLQLTSSKVVPTAAKRAILAFLQQAPEAAGYEHHSNGIIDMMVELKGKFTKERNTLQMEHRTSMNAAELQKQALTDSISQSKDDLTNTQQFKTDTDAKRASDQGQKEQTEAAKAEDSSYLADTQATCSRKSETYEARQKTRAEEQTAINAAIDVLSNKVSGRQAANMFAQLRASGPVLREKAVKFLFDKAMKLNSSTLKLVATSASAGDPFKKIRGLIRELIDKLVAERQAEAEEHAWCETELAANKQTRDKLQTEMEELNAKAAQAKARKESAAERSAQLTDDLSALAKATAEATEQRNAEASKNANTIADCKDGQAGVEEAIKILKEFYDNNESTSTGAAARGDMADVDMSGDNTQHQAGHNVIVMLTQLVSDFAKLEAETQADEAQAAAEYKSFKNDSDQNKAVKERDNEMQKAERDEQENDENETNDELSNTMKENKAAMDVYAGLKKKCVDTGLSYEERVQKRQEEIQSLKEGLEILEQAA